MGLYHKKNKKQINEITLTGVAQWVEHCSLNQKAASSIPGQGTCLGYWPGPRVGGVQEATNRCFSCTLMFLFLSFSSLSLSLKINKQINLLKINEINIRNKFESSVAHLVFLMTIGSWLAERSPYLPLQENLIVQFWITYRELLIESGWELQAPLCQGDF